MGLAVNVAINLGSERRQTELEWDAALDRIRAIAKEHREGLLRVLTDEGPSVVGCAHGRYLLMFAQGDTLRVDRYDSKNTRIARYRI